MGRFSVKFSLFSLYLLGTSLAWAANNASLTISGYVPPNASAELNYNSAISFESADPNQQEFEIGNLLLSFNTILGITVALENTSDIPGNNLIRSYQLSSKINRSKEPKDQAKQSKHALQLKLQDSLAKKNFKDRLLLTVSAN